jgi:CRISPR-associated protein Cas6
MNIINLSFPVKGTYLPADHNYKLHGALCKEVSILNQLDHFAVNTIAGKPDKQGKIQLLRGSRLLLRLPVEYIAQVYPLAGKTLTIGGYPIQLGNPELQTLQPTDALSARLVTIKGYTEPESFLDAAQRQLDALEIQANLGIPANDEGEPKRLTLRITKPERSYTIVGFSLVVSDLNPDDSIKLQIHGLGGKRRIGCGVFNPVINVYRKSRRDSHAATTIG